MNTLANILTVVLAAAARLAELGKWPSWMNADALGARVPSADKTAGGFDAAIACALDIVPRDKQRLLAILHGFYSPEAIEQVRREAVEMDPDSETTWWLAMSSVCREGGVNEDFFSQQLEAAQLLANAPDMRVQVARKKFKVIAESYRLLDGIPFVTKDGGMQGAYLHGYNWGVEWSDAYGFFFVSTMQPSLGVFERNFPFSDRRDKNGDTISGMLKSKTLQRCKCSSWDEVNAVVKMVRENLGAPKKVS